VRNVLRHLGLHVARLIRVSFGPFQLGEIEDGGISEVPTRVLRDQLGEKLARLAGTDFAAPIVTRQKKPETPAAPLPSRSEAKPRDGSGAGSRRAQSQASAHRVPKRKANSSVRGVARARGLRSAITRRNAAGGRSEESVKCASSADGCADARSRRRSLKTYGQPPTGCASRCSTS